ELLALGGHCQERMERPGSDQRPATAMGYAELCVRDGGSRGTGAGRQGCGAQLLQWGRPCARDKAAREESIVHAERALLARRGGCSAQLCCGGSAAQATLTGALFS